MKRMKYLKLIGILLLFSAKLKAQTDAINIIQRPIEFNQVRIDLSLDYMYPLWYYTESTNNKSFNDCTSLYRSWYVGA